MRLLIIFSILTFATVAAVGQKTSEIISPIAGVLSEYDSAWNKKDVAGVSRVLADGYAYFSSTGGITDRKATLEFLASPEYKLTSAQRSEFRLLSNTGNVVVLSSRWKGRGTYGKEEINDDQRCGLVFIKQGKNWKLLSEHCVQIVTK
jgi:ketosteroid isomerase-like protein